MLISSIHKVHPSTVQMCCTDTYTCMLSNIQKPEIHSLKVVHRLAVLCVRRKKPRSTKLEGPSATNTVEKSSSSTSISSSDTKQTARDAVGSHLAIKEARPFFPLDANIVVGMLS